MLISAIALGLAVSGVSLFAYSCVKSQDASLAVYNEQLAQLSQQLAEMVGKHVLLRTTDTKLKTGVILSVSGRMVFLDIRKLQRDKENPEVIKPNTGSPLPDEVQLVDSGEIEVVHDCSHYVPTIPEDEGYGGGGD